jgi:hypothetical protein
MIHSKFGYLYKKLNQQAWIAFIYLNLGAVSNNMRDAAGDSNNFINSIPSPLFCFLFLDKTRLAVGILLRTNGVEKVYRRGLIDELIGNTNTAIHA